MSSKAAKVQMLHDVCGLSEHECRDALEAAKGSVEDALCAVVRAKKVRLADLDERMISIGLMMQLYEIDGADENREYKRKSKKWKQRTDKLKNKPITLRLPPLPALTLHAHEWVGKDKLKSWAGFRPRANLEGGWSASRSRSRRGSKVVPEVKVALPRPIRDNNDSKPRKPTPEHVAAYKHLKEHEAEVTAAVHSAIVREFFSEPSEHFSDLIIKTSEDLRDHIGLESITLFPYAKQGHAYLGMFIRCTWDEEHHVGVVVHKSRVVTVGIGDDATRYENAIDDGGKLMDGWGW